MKTALEILLYTFAVFSGFEFISEKDSKNKLIYLLGFIAMALLVFLIHTRMVN
jgi:hypothetical protein